MTVGYSEMSEKTHSFYDKKLSVIRFTSGYGGYSEVALSRETEIHELLDKIIGLLVSEGWHPETIESAICEKAYMIQEEDKVQGQSSKDGDEKQGHSLKNNDFMSEKMKSQADWDAVEKSAKTDYEQPDWAIGQTIRASGLVEDECEHGVGHPNKMWLKEHSDEAHWEVHGCDGCCTRKNTNRKKAK